MNLALTPHPSSTFSQKGWEIHVEILPSKSTLWLHYRVNGALAMLEIPSHHQSPSRKDGLWKTTCLELFLRAKGTHFPYLEFNFSPTSDWAYYAFTGYREGMHSPEIRGSIPITCQHNERELTLTAEIPREMLIPGSGNNCRFEAGLSVVLRTLGGKTDYWAAIHPDTQPDFHHPDSFLTLITP